MACSVLQEMANSVYLVMEVSSQGKHRAQQDRHSGYKHALLTFPSWDFGNTYTGQVQETGNGLRTLSQAGDIWLCAHVRPLSFAVL